MKPASWGLIAVVLTIAGCAPPGADRPAAETSHLRRSVEVGGQPVSYLLAGPSAAAPRLILVHGTPGDAAGWTNYVLDPPPGLEVAALDRPGFGESGPEGAVTALADQAAAVAALMPADRASILLGHSLGGPIVALAAARHPDRVAAIILLAASLDPGLEKIHPMQHVGAWGPVRALLPRAIRNANAELMDLEPELAALAEVLPLIRCPVLIVHGTADDLVPVANVDFMQRHLTGSCRVETIVLPDRNHFLPWNAEDVVRAAIAQAGEMAC